MQAVAEKLSRLEEDYPEIDDPFFFEVAHHVSAHTMSDIPAQWALYRSIAYIVKHQIPGDIVECGVWNGGSILLAAYALKHLGDTSRKLYLYDTFDGMPRPDPERDIDNRGEQALGAWMMSKLEGKKWGFGGDVTLVKQVVYSSGYPQENFVFVPGMVENTMPATMPHAISLLRLDTDLYASTAHELVHAYPLLSPGGVLILDDYGYTLGSRQATNEYFAEQNVPMLLSRINGNVYIGVKR